MQGTIKFYCIIFCLLCSLSSVTQASNFSFLKDSILHQLPDSDFQLLKREAVSVLENSPDKKITKWEAPTSKINTKIMPKLSYSENGLPCRRTLFQLIAPPKSSETYGFTICKNPDGKWQISQSRLQNLTENDVQILEQQVMQLFDENKVGEPLTWFNPATKITGTLVLVEARMKKMKACNKIAISLFDSAGVSLEGQYLFCKNDKGWQRVGL